MAPPCRRWALWGLSLLVPVLFAVVGVAIRDSVPETWDEQFDQDIGRFYLHQWSKGGVEALERRFIPLQRHYGPAFNIVVVALHELLHDRLRWVTNPVASHHMASLLATSLMLWATFWVGHRLWGPAVGFGGATLLALLPQLVAHSQNNLKDTPLAMAFTVAVWAYVEMARGGRWWWAAVGGCAVGYAFAIKPNGLLVWVVIAPWLLLVAPLTWRRVVELVRAGAVSAAAATATVLAVWPYYRSQPWLRLQETLATFRHHVYNELVFYLGQHYPAHDVPWHFPYVMLAVYTPVMVLLLVGFSLVLAVRAWWQRRAAEAGAYLLGWLWLLVPPTVQVLSGAAKLDGIRHYLAVLPALALLAAAAAHQLWRWAAGNRLQRAGLGAAGVALGAYVLFVNVSYHPYQNVYFNCLTGGTRGARERFELDYWGVSLAAAAKWLNTHAPAGSRVWLTIPGQHFFKLDRSRLHFVSGPSRRHHYKVNLIRGLLRTWDSEDDYLRPRRQPVFAVRVAGADLLQIFAYPEHRDVPAGSSLTPGRKEVAGVVPGLWAQLYDVELNAPQGGGWVLTSLALEGADNPCQGQPLGLRARGWLQVTKAGDYTFEISSDDDAVLFLDNVQVLSNASLATTRNQVRLGAGWYALQLDFRNEVGPARLRVSWGEGRDEPAHVLAAPALQHSAELP